MISMWLRGRDVSQHVASRSTTIRSMASTIFASVDGTWTSCREHRELWLIVHATCRLARRLGIRRFRRSWRAINQAKLVSPIASARTQIQFRPSTELLRERWEAC